MNSRCIHFIPKYTRDGIVDDKKVYTYIVLEQLVNDQNTTHVSIDSIIAKGLSSIHFEEKQAYVENSSLFYNCQSLTSY